MTAKPILLVILTMINTNAIAEDTRATPSPEKPIYIGDPAKPKAKLKRIRPSATPPALTAPIIIAKPTATPTGKKTEASPSPDATNETSADPGE